jgi:tetratricopeptide (TPR) repeat protein
MLGPFCGRHAELETMRRAWRRVSTGSGPECLVLLAESGLGKTRLAHVFYADLVRAATGQGAGRIYWPDGLSSDGANLQVNPDLQDCDAGQPMPFLWWGMRLVDPLGRNAVAAGVLSSHYERDLKPHLETLYRTRRARDRRSELLDIGRGLALDVAVDFVPFAGLVKTVGEAAFDVGKIISGVRADRAQVGADILSRTREASLNEQILEDLADWFDVEGASRPAVVLVDDAQFSGHDRGMVSFVEALSRLMTERNWPLLLLINHWEREWSTAGEADSTIANVVHAVRRGGELRSAIIRLRPIADLGPLLDGALPGLTEPQRAALLARADGNPRFLDEIARHALSPRGRMLFEGRDPGRALTERGLADLLERSVGLHDLIAERLAESPEAVQQAVALASLQGVEFMAGLVDALAGTLSADQEAVKRAIAEAETPHAYVARVDDGLAAFAQRIYFEVAREHLPACFDPDEAAQALDEAVRTIAREGRSAAFAAAEQSRFLALAANCFEQVADQDDLFVAAWALAQLMRAADRVADVVGCHVLAVRLAAVLEKLDDERLDADLDWLRETYLAAEVVGDRATQARTLERLLRLTRAAWADDANDWSGWMLARTLVLADLYHQQLGDHHAAADVRSEARAVLASLPDAAAEPALQEIRAKLAYGEGVSRQALGHFEAALGAARESLAAAAALQADDATRTPGALLTAQASQLLGSVARRCGALEQARQALEESVATLRELTPGAPLLVPKLAEALGELAAVARRQDDLGSAAIWLDESLALRRELRAGADTPQFRGMLAEGLLQSALLARQQGDSGRAREHALEAIDCLATVRDEASRPVAVIGLAHNLLAELDQDASQFGTALEHARRATELSRRVVLHEPLPDVRAWMLVCLATHATLARAMGLHTEADDLLREADGHFAELPEVLLTNLARTRDVLAACAAFAPRTGSVTTAERPGDPAV